MQKCYAKTHRIRIYMRKLTLFTDNSKTWHPLPKLGEIIINDGNIIPSSMCQNDMLLFTTKVAATVNATKYTIENDLTKRKKQTYIQTNGMYLSKAE